MKNLFYRLDDDGNARIYHADGSPVTRIDADVYPVGSNVSARYDHASGIVLTVADARTLRITEEC